MAHILNHNVGSVPGKTSEGLNNNVFQTPPPPFAPITAQGAGTPRAQGGANTTPLFATLGNVGLQTNAVPNTGGIQTPKFFDSNTIQAHMGSDSFIGDLRDRWEAQNGISGTSIEDFRAFGDQNVAEFANTVMQQSDFFTDQGLQQQFGLTGAGGQLTFEDQEAWARFSDENGIQFGTLSEGADGSAVIKDVMGNIVKMTPQQTAVFAENVNTFGEEKATILATLDAEQETADLAFTQEDADILFGREVMIDEKLTTLDELYGNTPQGNARAQDDWEAFLASDLDPDRPESGTWAQHFEDEQGIELPSITSEGFNAGLGTTDAMMDILMDEFIGWKVTENAKPPVVPDEIDPDAPTRADELEASFLDSFDDPSFGKISDALTEGIRTDEEIQSDFDDSRAFARDQQERFIKPETRAAGRESSGFLGGGVNSALARNQLSFDAAESTARVNFETAARDANLKAVDSAMEFAKTPAQVAKLYSEIGINLKTQDHIEAATSGMEMDTWLKQTLSSANLRFLEANADLAETSNLEAMLRISAAEGGFEANYLLDQARIYQESMGGIFANPIMGAIMGLIDLTMFENVGQSTPRGIGQDLAVAFAGAKTGSE